MSLLEKVDQDLRQAIKGKDESVIRTLRMLKSDIAYEKAKGTDELPEEKILEIITRAAKKRKESIEEFEKAGRNDLVLKEKEELAVIGTYLPEQVGEAEIINCVDRLITEMGISGKKDTGRLMGAVMKELKGRADGNAVKKVVSEKLETM